MQRKDIESSLKESAFNFFYWFSRFEYALKENRYLKNDKAGSKAEPNWEKFIKKYQGKYVLDDYGKRLLELNPLRQVVTDNKDLAWRQVGMGHCKTDMCKVVTLLKTVRNNLFHGGKHEAEGWDDPVRSQELLSVSIDVLNGLTKLGSIEDDYTRSY